MSTKITVNRRPTLFKCTKLDCAIDLLEKLNVSRHVIADNLFFIKQYIAALGSVCIRVYHQGRWDYGSEKFFSGVTGYKVINYTPSGFVKQNGVRILSS